MMQNDFILKDDEYIKDGIVFCKKCNTPCSVKFPDFTTRSLCQCQAKARDEKIIEEEKRQRLYQIQSLRASSLLTERYKNARFENIDLDRPKDFLTAYSRCIKFCENWDAVKECGASIYIYGDKGTGKTLLTACIANRLMDNLVPVHMTNLLEFSKKIRASYSVDGMTEDEVISQFARVPLLIIDDISMTTFAKNNEDTFLQSKFYDLINYRYNRQLPTIFSSNVSLTDLVNVNGLKPVIADRINGMCHAVIRLQGDSYRTKIAQETKPLF